VISLAAVQVDLSVFHQDHAGVKDVVTKNH
jgi:hypothetical protein